MYPERLRVVITPSHLDKGNRRDVRKSPLALAVGDALKEMGCDFSSVLAYMDNVYIFEGSTRHTARYYVPDDAWKLVAKHAAGKRVKPQTVVLEAIYRRAE